ncbi:MAG: ArsR family transcriptional regulator [Phycisphaerales bacterium]|nr:ArsR family transcriptional regulator [Phycisphaerales bacterium]
MSPMAVTERLSALAEPIRLRILRVLETQELSVGEVSSVVQLPQSTVSRHLKMLAEGGWLARRSEGTATFYRLTLDDLPAEARSLWVAVRDQLGSSSDLAEDARRVQSVLAERRADSQAFFGRVAGEWDDLRTQLFGDRFTQAGLLSLVNPTWTVADLGCGTGNASELLAPYVQKVMAVDQSDAMLAAARKRLSGQPNVEFIAGSLDRLPLPAASVDAAVCVLVLHHLDDPGAALGEMRRILRTDRGGGCGLVIDMLEHDRAEYRYAMGHKHMGFSKSRVLGMLKDAGFNLTTHRDLPGDPGGKGPGLFVAVGRL